MRFRSKFGKTYRSCRWVVMISLLAAASLYGQPQGMVLVPGATIRLEQYNRWREGLSAERFEMGPLGQFYVSDSVVTIPSFYIDRTEVTNRQFKKFLSETNYRPRFTDNFLRDWTDGEFPKGQGDYPVAWVDLEDALAYAKWAGKSLPTEMQWQYAAQGRDGRLFPWGDDVDSSRANVNSNGRTSVGSFPSGQSPFGCLDMVGNVWEWTDSKGSDGRHWYSYLRGGSWYQPRGSVWYVEGGMMSNYQRLKFWWSSPGLNRSSTIGFRCVKAIN